MIEETKTNLTLSQQWSWQFNGVGWFVVIASLVFLLFNLALVLSIPTAVVNRGWFLAIVWFQSLIVNTFHVMNPKGDTNRTPHAIWAGVSAVGIVFNVWYCNVILACVN